MMVGMVYFLYPDELAAVMELNEQTDDEDDEEIPYPFSQDHLPDKSRRICDRHSF